MADFPENTCFFGELFACKQKDPLSEASVTRIIKASKQYGDGIYNELEQQQQSTNENFTVHVHRKCIDKYCHPKNIRKALQDNASAGPSSCCK
ncbi:hypothetical protein ACOMHN_014882 [Nucella lapillus]